MQRFVALAALWWLAWSASPRAAFAADPPPYARLGTTDTGDVEISPANASGIVRVPGLAVSPASGSGSSDSTLDIRTSSAGVHMTSSPADGGSESRPVFINGVDSVERIDNLTRRMDALSPFEGGVYSPLAFDHVLLGNCSLGPGINAQQRPDCAMYQRVGNIVTIMGDLRVDLSLMADVAGTQALRITLPRHLPYSGVPTKAGGSLNPHRTNAPTFCEYVELRPQPTGLPNPYLSGQLERTAIYSLARPTDPDLSYLFYVANSFKVCTTTQPPPVQGCATYFGPPTAAGLTSGTDYRVFFKCIYHTDGIPIG